MTDGQVVRYADAAMYRSEEMPVGIDGLVRPRVYLLNATPDPFGSLAALNGIYVGRVRRSLAEVSDDERREAWAEVRKNVLGNGPLESIQFHMLIEGVTRAFTHQAVRSRASFFAQESLRFAVAEGQPWHHRVAYPPSLAAEPENLMADAEEMRRRELDPKYEWYSEPQQFSSPEARDYALKRDAWDDAVINAQQAYQRLIDAGVPAEDARGLMPHAITTRYHWICDLRTLLAESGKRLCTQAQFEWRAVFAEVVKALREFRPVGDFYGDSDTNWCWQYEAIAQALQPLCYQEGHCGFMSKFDRGCKIRERVERFAANSVRSESWDSTGQYDVAAGPVTGVSLFSGGSDRPVADMTEFRPLLPIYPKEWLTDPNAAKVAGFGEHK